ncbi:metallophosphoesterase [Roseateles sp. UC29_93]|uniref:STAND family AAA ATPase n=1 Tax=Roseateles sp. UC29_93 TaxID=3350177 RepID=UPI003670DA9A
MTAEKLLIVHLSDIHIRKETDAILQRANAIAAATFSHLPQVSNVLIAVSGDIVWSGQKDQYERATALITQVIECMRKEAPPVKIDLVVCPGNHDVDFDAHDEIRGAVLATLQTSGVKDVSQKLIDAATSVQNNFFSFRDAITSLPIERDNRLTWEHRIEIANQSIGIRCLNVAWMSEIKERQGMLHFPDTAVRPFNHGSKSGLNITILHHPFNWYAQSSYQPFKNAVRSESHLVLTGHEHYQNVGETQDIHSSPSVFVEGGVLFESHNDGATSTFNLVLLDLREEKYQTALLGWDGNRYVASVDESDWGSFRPLPSKGSQQMQLTDQFAASLEDPGATFSHPAKKTLSLSDIFVWPDLTFLDDTSVVKRHHSAAMFESLENIGSPGVLIKGDEKLGRTTLLYRYFSSYHRRGFLPLYIRGNWLQRQHLAEPLKALNFALDRQYLRTQHTNFHQETKEKKILLLDDLHNSNLTGKTLSDLLETLFNHFGAVIVTGKDGPEALDLISTDRVPALQKLKHFDIREFGHKKRYELIRRWVAIGQTTEEGSQEWMATIDKSEKDLTTAVGRQLVPAVPIFLLTLLQSAEAKRSADLQNSALGHYYHYLITSSLETIGVQRDQWSEVFNYCSNLAWTLHSSARKELSDAEIHAFSAAYSREFTPIAPGKRLRELTQAGILITVDDAYQFRYPYLYFMFLGQYIADHLHEPEVDNVITSLCEDLHLRDNANIVLFVSHHTKSPVIYERIANSLVNCFADATPFDFIEDVKNINKLINEVPTLLFDDVPGRDHRAEMRARQDSMEDRSSKSVAETEEQLGSAAAITRLFRGMEILGQFLKNHYGTTKNPIKNNLIETLIHSGLRGLRGTTEILIAHTESLSDMIERAIRDSRGDLEEYQRKQMARQVIFDALGMIAFAFTQKASTAIGSEFLKGNLSEVAGNSGKLSYRLIQMAHQLDLPEPIPFDSVKALRKEMDNNLFAIAMLRSMALRHLHMFKVPFRDKQRLCSELGIEIPQQMAIQHDRARK